MTILTVEEVVERVAKYFCVQPKEIYRHHRTRRLSEIRMIAMYMSRLFTAQSYPNIGKIMERTHPTIMHGINRISKRIASDNNFARMIQEIQNFVGGLQAEDEQ